MLYTPSLLIYPLNFPFAFFSLYNSTQQQRSEVKEATGPKNSMRGYRYEKLLPEASAAGPYALPLADSLLGRLDQIDLRLRQLEERHTPAESYFSADLRQAAAARIGHHHQCKSLSSALRDVHLKGNLMDRLHLLETRIRQLSYELDKGNSSSSSCGCLEASMESIPVEEKKKEGRMLGGSWRASDIFHRGARELQGHKAKSKTSTCAKDSKEAMDVVEKRASAMCRNEKRRMGRTRLYRKWFPVGC